jgi:hypothetical protein
MGLRRRQLLAATSLVAAPAVLIPGRSITNQKIVFVASAPAADRGSRSATRMSSSPAALALPLSLHVMSVTPTPLAHFVLT